MKKIKTRLIPFQSLVIIKIILKYLILLNKKIYMNYFFIIIFLLSIYILFLYIIFYINLFLLINHLFFDKNSNVVNF